MQFVTQDIVGYDVCTQPASAIVEQVMRRLRDRVRPCCVFACLNPHSVEMAAVDADFRLAMKNADFLTADGIGVVYVSRLMGGHIRQRITGMDVFVALSRAMNDHGGLSCFFLGSTEPTLAKVRDRMALEFPNVRIAGTLSPPFKPAFDAADTDAMLDRINSSRADVLWVGMSAPKQEKWLHANRHRLDVSFAGPIGAVFDFYSGNIRRAGPTVQRLGLEWLPRLIQEPRRLWRRSVISAPAFFLRSFRYRLAQRRAGRST